MEISNIERFFLNTLLRISLAGVALILISDIFFYPDDKQSIVIDCAVLGACMMSYVFRRKHSVASVLILTSIVLASILYQCITIPLSTTNSLSILLLIGFIHAVMLKGLLQWTMQIITLGIVITIFLLQFFNPGMMDTSDKNELITILITYSVIFFILTYATSVLKSNYDRINKDLQRTVEDTNQKAAKIEAQNEELMRMQEVLNGLNSDLESKVLERTAKIQLQNEVLMRYSYTNAHHLRGPVARMLGLAQVYRLDPSASADSIISMMVEQAHEIDQVVQQINVHLEEGHQQ